MKAEQKKAFRIIEGEGGNPPEPEVSANEWLAGKRGKVDVTRTEIEGDVLNIYFRMRN